MAKLVLTLTVNPAIDRIFLVDRLVFEDRGYILSTTEAAGGRGINAARVLTSFGTKVLAITTTGDNGTQLEDLLERDGFEREFVKIKHPIRTNLTISDRQGLSVKLNERGPTLSDFDSSRIIKAVAKSTAKGFVADVVRKRTARVRREILYEANSVSNGEQSRDDAGY